MILGPAKDPSAHRFARISLAVLGSSLLAILLWGQNVLGACWGPADDHEIVGALGRDGVLRLDEVIPEILETEVGQPGTVPRFRPSYYGLRTLEMLLWGDNPALWYSCRVALFAWSAFVLWWLFDELFGTALAASFTLLSSSGAYWADIWGRLGPSEAYACSGVAASAFGIHLIVRARSNARRWIGWLLTSAGCALAIGSKENMLIFLLAPAGILWRERKRGTLSRGQAILGISTIGYGVAIGILVAIAIHRSGADVYGRPLTVSSLVGFLLELPRQNWAPIAIFLIALLGWGLSRLVRRRSEANANSPVEEYCRRLSKVEGILVLALLSQLLFYAGSQPNARFEFPSALFRLGSLAAPLFVLIAMPSEKRVQVRLAALGGSLLFLAVTTHRGFGEIVALGRRHQAVACAFTHAVDRIESAQRENPGASIVIWSSSVEDFERIWALRTFLYARGVAEPLVLKTPEPYPARRFTPELAQLLRREIRKMQSGSLHGFASSSALFTSGECIALGLAEEPPLGNCRSLGTIKPDRRR